MRLPRVLIVADNISLEMGGEAAIPCQYIKHFHKRGVAVWIVCHGRVRDELRAVFSDTWDRIHFVSDTRLMMRIWRLGRLFPERVGDHIFGGIRRVLAADSTVGLPRRWFARTPSTSFTSRRRFHPRP